ncbi:MAG: erythromycin esterase family protein [Planctomycetes bacterium]|nr:erythromycin esterase family protein [Planctomycetota bacterium]
MNFASNAGLTFLSLVACIPMGGCDPVPDTPATAWVKRRAIPFATSQAGHGLEDLHPLKAVIGDARIVALGEPTHGTREAFQMKHRLLEYLVEELGFSVFSIEANMPEAYALNAYVTEGKGDPKKLIAGMYFWTWNTQEVLAMVEWMRDWNQKHPPESGKPRLQFTGFDMQTQTVALRLVEEFLKIQDPEFFEQTRASLVQLKSYSPHATGNSFGCATGKFPVNEARGKKIRFSGWIKTENVDDAWAGLWWRVDGPTPTFDNMSDRGPRGTADWEERSIEVTVPADAKAIYFGLVKPGGGKAWFDTLRIEVDGTPWTNPEFDLDFEHPQPNGIIAADPMRGPASPDCPGTIDPRVSKSGASSFRLEKIELPGELKAAEASAIAKDVLDHMVNARDAYVKKTDAWSADWAIQNARVVHQWTGLATDGASASGHRDQCMADNVEWILAQNPGKRVVLWAHNGHVARSNVLGLRWMGLHLEEKFPGQMVVFGFATGRGRYTAMGGTDRPGLHSDNELQVPPPGSVESILASTGMPRLFLDIRRASEDDPASAWLTVPTPMRSIGALAMESQFFPVVPKDLFDVLIWQETTTASVPLGRW